MEVLSTPRRAKLGNGAPGESTGIGDDGRG